MKKVVCKQCGVTTKKYEREASLFCNRNCYMDWKRNNPNTKPYKDKVLISGYYYIYKPEHPNAIKKGRYVAEHRLLAEEKIGRYLKGNEDVHHINGIKTDNRIENIVVLTKSQHSKLHADEKVRKNGKF